MTTQMPSNTDVTSDGQQAHAVFKRDSSLVVALWDAAEKGDAARIRELVALGVDVSIRNQEGWTPLHIATKHGHADAMRALIAARSMQRMVTAGIDLRHPALTWNEALQTKTETSTAS